MAFWNFVSDNWLTLLNSFIILVVIPTLNVRRNHKWTKKLETYKSTLNKEMEEYKTNLNLRYYRKSSFSKDELDILKQLWAYSTETFYSFNKTCAAFKTYPDVNKMSEQGLKEYLSNIKSITISDKERVLNSNNKQEEIIKILDFISLREANNNLYDCIKYLDKNSIFINPIIKEKFDLLSKKMRSTLISYDMYLRMEIQDFDGKTIYEVHSNALKEISFLKKEIEKEIQQVLFSEK